jgi:putative phosphonate metabolism protein
MSARYAIYYAPDAASDLAGAGARWLGRDALARAALEQPGVPGLAPRRFAALTAEPRRYGFHATLKPPMRLAAGATEAMLRDALARFAATTQACPLPALGVRRLEHFLAIVPTGDASALGAFASRVVEAFDRFREPPADAELAKRRALGLTARQEALLAHWGYPYVFDEFRFHLTLSGNLRDVPAREAAALEAAAADYFAPSFAAPLAIDALALFVEPTSGAPFEQRERFALRMGA